MDSNELPINIYIPLSYTGRQWSREPSAKDDVLYVRRDALIDNVEYKSASPERRSYGGRNTLRSATLEHNELASFLTLEFSDKEHTHMFRADAVIEDVANQLRYFAGKLLE